MPVELNHTIIAAKNREESAEFLAHILGLEVGPVFGPFLPVQTSNGVTLDFASVPDGQPVTTQHYAFLVTEAEFDQIFARITAAGLKIWADPHGQHPDEINHNDGGRGVYFFDPSGHGMEVITRPYGSGSA